MAKVKVIKVTEWEDAKDAKTVGEYDGSYTAKCVARALAGEFNTWCDGKTTYYVIESDSIVVRYYNRAEWLKKWGVSYDEWQVLEHSLDYETSAVLGMLNKKGICAENVIDESGEYALPKVVETYEEK